MLKREFNLFGKSLRQMRRKQDLTQDDLGKIAGVHSQYISNVERGLCGLPPYAVKAIVKKYPQEKQIFKEAMRKDSEAAMEKYFEEVFK